MSATLALEGSVIMRKKQKNLSGLGRSPNRGQPRSRLRCTEGRVDSVEADQIAGWAWDENHPDSPVVLDIHDGKRLLATISADQFRQDLFDAGKGNGKHGFCYPMAFSLTDGKVHTIRVTASGTDVELPHLQTMCSDDIPSPPKEMLLTTGHPDAKAFREAGQGVVAACRVLCKLRPHQKVLDVGCGVGRLAIPLTRYLSDRGSYDGIDIIPQMIDWCMENISTKYPNFRFQLADVYNGFYNPSGLLKATEYTFPYRVESFDLVFLGSLFTHLLPAEMENYFREIARVLKGGGRCMISFFILDGGSFKQAEKKPSDLEFKYKCEGYCTANKNVPEAAVAYEEEYLRALYRQYRLKIVEPIQFGVQDLVVARKG
jgi:SAM-dependent methyltransferase